MEEQMQIKLEENLLDDLTRQIDDANNQRNEPLFQIEQFINKLNKPSDINSQEEYVPQIENKENMNIQNLENCIEKQFFVDQKSSELKIEQKNGLENKEEEIIEAKQDIYENSNFIFTNQNSVNLVQDSILKTNRSKSDHSINRQNSIKFEISPPRNLINEQEKLKIMNRQPTPYTKTEKQQKNLDLEPKTLKYGPIPINKQNARNTLNQAIQMYKYPGKQNQTNFLFKKPFISSEVQIKAKIPEKVIKTNDIRYKPSNIAKFCVQCDQQIEKDAKTNTLPCCHKVHQLCQEKSGKRNFECPKCNNKNRFI